MTTATWITVALLAPFWWATGLFILALLGMVSPGLNARVSRLFDRLERAPDETAIPQQIAA